MAAQTVHHLKTARGDEIFVTLVDNPPSTDPLAEQVPLLARVPLLERRVQLTIFDVDGTLAPTVEMSYQDAVAFFHEAMVTLMGDVA